MNSSSGHEWEDASELLPALQTSFREARVFPPRSKPKPPHPLTSRSPSGSILLIALVLITGFAAQMTLRRAVGSYWVSLATSSSVARAIEADALNPVARRREASLAAQRSGDPAQALAGLRRAVELAQLDLPSRLDLAATLQASGDDDEAEAALLEAIDLGLGYRPRWSLLNFYLREGRIDEFWRSVRDTLRAHPETTAEVLGLCWRAFDDSSLILEKAIPDAPEVLRRYFERLLEEERVGALEELWPRFAPVMEERDAQMASAFLESLVAAGQVGPAVEVWNHLCRQSFIPYIPLHYPEGPYLTNSDFAASISGAGFDWRIPPAEGALRLQQSTEFGGRTLEVRLSGEQAEDTLLLAQIIPLPPGSYSFRWEYQTQRLPRSTGLSWVARDNGTGRALAQSPDIEGADDHWNKTGFHIEAPPDLRFLRLELRYRRAEHAENLRGRLVLRETSLTVVEPQEASE